MQYCYIIDCNSLVVLTTCNKLVDIVKLVTRLFTIIRWPTSVIYANRKPHDTKTKATTRKQKPRHKNKSHGTIAKATAQKKKLTAQKQKPRHKSKSHGTNEKTHGTKAETAARKQKRRHKRKKMATDILSPF